jgi:hypothetical protein
MKPASVVVASIALIVALSPSAAAQGVTTVAYPGGSSASTSPSTNAIPFSTLFGSDIRYQLYVPGATLPSRPAMLTDIAFAPASPATFVMTTLVLSVGHATPGAPVCNLNANSNDLRVQFTGPHTWTYASNAWASLGLPLLFPYNGGNQDLIIEIRIMGASGNTGLSFRDRDTGTNIQRSYNSNPGGFNATTCTDNGSLGLKVALTFVQPDVFVPNSPAHGMPLLLDFRSPTDPLTPYIGGLSLGTGPLTFNASDPRTIGLTYDLLLDFALNNQFVFPGLTGSLDANGLGTALVPIPLGLPSGFTFHASFVTIDLAFPSTVRSIALTRSIVLP